MFLNPTAATATTRRLVTTGFDPMMVVMFMLDLAQRARCNIREADDVLLKDVGNVIGVCGVA